MESLSVNLAIRLRIIFMGTPGLACTSLRALLEDPQFEVLAVVTQPDRPRGRELKLQPSPVKELALNHGLAIFQPAKARDETFLASLRPFEPDLIAVAAYGQILPPALLELPRLGCLNVHTSLLPKYRGAAPIQWALLNGDSETGVTIMKMDEGLDTGAILTQDQTPITDQDDAPSLQDRLAVMGARLLVRSIPDYASGKLEPRPQPSEGVGYARKIRKEDGVIHWSDPAAKIRNQVRALIPWPGTTTRLPDSKATLLKIWQADVDSLQGAPGEILSADVSGIVVGCGENSLRILLLQREGARPLTPQQFLAGCPLARGQRLGTSDRAEPSRTTTNQADN